MESLNEQIIKKFKDKDILGISHKVSKCFRGILTRDERDSCILNAIWKALDSYDLSKGVKFTSYLYKGVFLECVKQAKFNKVGRDFEPLYDNHFSFDDQEIESMEMLEIVKQGPHSDLVIDRFYYNMTYKEIASEKKVSKETIRNKVKKNFKKTKYKMV